LQLAHQIGDVLDQAPDRLAVKADKYRRRRAVKIFGGSELRPLLPVLRGISSLVSMAVVKFSSGITLSPAVIDCVNSILSFSVSSAAILSKLVLVDGKIRLTIRCSSDTLVSAEFDRPEQLLVRPYVRTADHAVTVLLVPTRDLRWWLARCRLKVSAPSKSAFGRLLRRRKTGADLRRKKKKRDGRTKNNTLPQH
jgi:hypothetical protein